MVVIHHWLKLAKFAVSAAMLGAFLVLLFIRMEAQVITPGERLAKHDAEIAHLMQSNAAVREQLEVLLARSESNANRLSRLEAVGAACGFLLMVLQAFAKVTGRKLNASKE